MKRAALSLASVLVAVFLHGQSTAPSSPAAPSRIYTAEELEAIPLLPPRAGKSVKKALFDGKTLNGWEGNMDWWSVKDGAIVGKFDSKVPTSFLFTKEHFSDFRLTLM